MYLSKRIQGEPWIRPSIPEISLELAGLIALADISVAFKRTALTGNAAFLDTFVLARLHGQQHSPELNGGEYPAAGTITTGYVFRAENQGTVFYLQKMGRTGHLTTLTVESPTKHSMTWADKIFPWRNANKISGLAYALCILLFGIFVVLVLAPNRLFNVIIIQRRSKPAWFGADEGDTRGDLIILLSQDRWIRLRGLVNDLKAVTSGQWLRDLTRLESTIIGFATLLFHLDTALASNLTQSGKIMLVVLLTGTAGLLDIANASTEELLMHERIIKLDGDRKFYERRLVLAEQLVNESGRSD